MADKVRRGREMLVRRILVVTTVLLVVLGSGSAWAAASSEKLAGKVQAAGLGCDDYEEQERPTRAIGAPTPATEGECTADGEQIEFHTFKDAELLGQALTAAQEIGCEFAEAGTGKNVHRLVVGKTWIVNTESKSTAKKVAKATGGKADVIRCDDD
jgi:hypothetical protein